MIRIHTLFTERCSDEEVAAANALLDAQERDRRDRFVFPEHARLFTLAHGLVRRTLSDHLGTSDLRFTENQYGKPSVPGVEFNLSHTKGLIALGLSDEGALGVDVEAFNRNTDVLNVAQHSFSDLEAADVTACAPAGRKERFFRYWTLKESYIKARGMGLHLPLKAFSFLLDEPHTEHTSRIRIKMRADLNDTPERWYFEQTKLAGGFFLAVCAERTHASTPTIVRI